MAQLDVTQRSILSGPVSALNKETDGSIFIPAIDFQVVQTAGTATAITQTRIAAGQFAQTVPTVAGGNTYAFGVLLNAYFLDKIGTDPALGTKAAAGVVATGDAMRPGSLLSTAPIPAGLGHDIRGVQITGLSLVYRVNSASTTSITPVFVRSAWAGGAVPPTGTNPATMTGTPTVTNSANVVIFAMTMTGTVLVGNNLANTADALEVVFVNPAGTTVDFIGVVMPYSYNIL